MSNRKVYTKPATVGFILLTSLAAYLLLSYQTQRYEFLKLSLLFSALFACYLFLVRKEIATKYFRLLLVAGIIFRFCLLFSTPNLSDDVYRFIWDGKLSAAGLNPYNYLPSEIHPQPGNEGISSSLFNALNSKEYHTIYPPILQFVFWLGGIFFQSIASAIMFFKSVIVLSEIGNVYFLMVLLKLFQKPLQNALIYFLNPLVIVELTGNVHLEPLMFFFMLAAAVLFIKNKRWLSSVAFGLSIATKLVPVIFIPLIVYTLGWKKGVLYALITGAITILLFAVWIDSTTIHHFFASVDLFFQRFEFNASLYYVVRGIGHAAKGYNIIQWSGPAMMLVAGLFIFIVSVRKTNSPSSFFIKPLLISTILYFFATTVHPWYITLPLILSVFTTFTYPILWSYMVIFSYHAYYADSVRENLWLVAICYILVMGLAVIEFQNQLRRKITGIA